MSVSSIEVRIKSDDIPRLRQQGWKLEVRECATITPTVSPIWLRWLHFVGLVAMLAWMDLRLGLGTSEQLLGLSIWLLSTIVSNQQGRRFIP